MQKTIDPQLVEGPHEFQARDGIMYIYRNGECRTAMRISTFTAFVTGGMRAIQDWHRSEGAPVVPIKRKRLGHG